MVLPLLFVVFTFPFLPFCSCAETLVLCPATFFPSICSPPTRESHAVSPHRQRTAHHWSVNLPSGRFCPVRLPLLNSLLSKLRLGRREKYLRAFSRFFSFFSFFPTAPRARRPQTKQAETGRPRQQGTEAHSSVPLISFIFIFACCLLISCPPAR